MQNCRTFENNSTVNKGNSKWRLTSGGTSFSGSWLSRVVRSSVDFFEKNVIFCVFQSQSGEEFGANLPWKLIKFVFCFSGQLGAPQTSTKMVWWDIHVFSHEDGWLVASIVAFNNNRSFFSFSTNWRRT